MYIIIYPKPPQIIRGFTFLIGATMPRKTTKTKAKTKAGKLPDDALIFEALRGNGGNVAKTATTLKVPKNDIYYWLRKEPARKLILEQIRADYDDDIMDMAITALERNLKSTDSRVTNPAIAIAFKYFGKRRGYVPASYNENENTGNIKVEVIRE